MSSDLELASDPSADEMELRRLAQSDDLLVRRAVSENVSCPKNTLAKLFLEFPAEVIANPATALFDLDSRWRMEWIPREWRQSVASNNQTDHTVLDFLTADIEWDVRADVARNSSSPSWILEKLYNDHSSEVLSSVAANKNTSVDRLVQFARSDNWYHRVMLTHNQNTPHEVWMVLAHDKNDDVAQSVASSPLAPVSALVLLVNHPSRYVRKNVFNNPNTPGHVRQSIVLSSS